MKADANKRAIMRLHQLCAQLNYRRFDEHFFKRLETVSKCVDEVESRRLQNLLPGLDPCAARALFVVYQSILQDMSNRIADIQLEQAGLILSGNQVLRDLYARLQENPDLDIEGLL